jgi:tRNA threonylcarbamoyladenosine biosynthesis protein TsaE
MTSETITHSAEETISFGRRLVREIPPPQFIVLKGDLGAGKTTLVKGIAEGFQASNEEEVTSPTFTLVHEYRGPHATVYHIDLYRIETERELETLALDDLRTPESVVLVEWGDKFSSVMRERTLEISIEQTGESDRLIRVSEA